MHRLAWNRVGWDNNVGFFLSLFLIITILFLFCSKFSFSLKYIDLIKEINKESPNLINSCSVVVFLMKRRWLTEVWHRSLELWNKKAGRQRLLTTSYSVRLALCAHYQEISKQTRRDSCATDAQHIDVCHWQGIVRAKDWECKERIRHSYEGQVSQGLAEIISDAVFSSGSS